MQQNIIIHLDNRYQLATISQTYPNNYQVIIYPEKVKRKIKQEHIIYPLQTAETIDEFNTKVRCVLETIDSLLLYELLESYDAHSISQLAELYFGNTYTEIDKTALLFKLEQKNIQYNNYLNGTFSKNTIAEVTVRQNIEDLRLLEQQTIQTYYGKIVASYAQYQELYKKSPTALARLNAQDLALPKFDLIKLLNNPDKECQIYKAFQLAQQELNVPLVSICYALGLINNLEDFFYESFIKKVFRQGINYQNLGAYDLPPQTNTITRVFSIDDASTKEIDDAFSVAIVNTGYKIGIHIAAPALDKTLARNALDQIATIYYPGNKITMLGSDVINEFSLNQGTIKASVSLYFNVDLEYNILDYTTTLESLYINDNLRIEQLDTLWDENNTIVKDHSYSTELRILHTFAAHLEQIRGKQNSNHELDYNFSINEQEQISITPRKRDTPVDKLVSELMILANSTWGRLLTNNLVPALYRSKRQNYPVETTTSPLPHGGLNVDYYTWASSPLRRAVDYINQAQIIGMILNHSYLAKEYLFELAENFDNQYSKYMEFQNKMERYWSLRYLIQEKVIITKATITYKYKAMLHGVPLAINLEGFITNPVRDLVVVVNIFNIDLINLTFEFKLIN